MIDSWTKKQPDLMGEFFRKLKKKPLSKSAIESLQTVSLVFKMIQSGGDGIIKDCILNITFFEKLRDDWNAARMKATSETDLGIMNHKSIKLTFLKN